MSLKKQSIYLISVLFTLVSYNQAYADGLNDNKEPPRMLTLYGKVDPRLSVWAVTTYSPTDYRTDIDDGSGCTHDYYIAGGGRRRPWLDWEVVEVIPDEHNEYKVTIPIDYIGENKCGYRYYDTMISIRRDKQDELFAHIVVLNDKPSPNNVYQGTKGGGETGLGRLIPGEDTDKAHYQIASGSKIVCYTEHHEASDHKLRKRPVYNSFICEPEVASEVNGVDKIESVTLNIDIEVDESRCFGWPNFEGKQQGRKKYQDFFRDFEPEPTWWQQIKHFFNN